LLSLLLLLSSLLLLYDKLYIYVIICILIHVCNIAQYSIVQYTIFRQVIHMSRLVPRNCWVADVSESSLSFPLGHHGPTLHRVSQALKKDAPGRSQTLVETSAQILETTSYQGIMKTGTFQTQTHFPLDKYCRLSRPKYLPHLTSNEITTEKE
jgi:hypothetical protein